MEKHQKFTDVNIQLSFWEKFLMVRDELHNTAGALEDVPGCAHLSSLWDDSIQYCFDIVVQID